jgi:hypothetical protein
LFADAWPVNHKERIMPQEDLDKFGALLMHRVRDVSISEMDQGLKGKAKDIISKRLRDILTAKDLEVDDKILKMVPLIVDTTLHYVLWMFESEEELTISIRTSPQSVENIVELSDGLSGELYSSEGWVARFSEERADEITTGDLPL